MKTIQTPMRKTSTLIYLYENFEDSKNEIYNYDDLLFDEFSDILNVLNIKSYSPSEKKVNEILEFAKTYIQES